MKLSRRSFLAGSAAAGTSLFLYHFVGGVKTIVAEIPGGTLATDDIEKFVTPMLIPPVMPKVAQIRERGGKPIDYYEISVKQFNAADAAGGDAADAGLGLRCRQRRWEQERGAHQPAQRALAHDRGGLAAPGPGQVDQRPQGCQRELPAPPPAGGSDAPLGKSARRGGWPGHAAGVRRDARGRTRARSRMVTHVHGAVGVGDESDGYAEAWYLPDASDIPDGYATEGTWHGFFATKAASSFGEVWDKGYAVFQYPNENRASTIWYHDHSLGMTRLNVYAGPAGFYLIRGGPDDMVLDSRAKGKKPQPAVLPGPAPKDGDKFPSNKTYYEIPIAIQDRSFNTDGSLFYPDTRAVLRRDRRALHRRRWRVLADLEPRVLRQHDHRQRQHLAVPGGGAAPLPVPVPERLPVAFPHPRLQRPAGGEGLADRQ